MRHRTDWDLKMVAVALCVDPVAVLARTQAGTFPIYDYLEAPLQPYWYGSTVWRWLQGIFIAVELCVSLQNMVDLCEAVEGADASTKK